MFSKPSPPSYKFLRNTVLVQFIILGGLVAYTNHLSTIRTKQHINIEMMKMRIDELVDPKKAPAPRKKHPDEVSV